MKTLKEHFEPKTNDIYERYTFITADKEQNGNTIKYVTRLKKLSNLCEFGALHNQRIRDRIVLGTKDSGARSRMLRAPDLTLDKAIDMCRESEIADQKMKILSASEAAANYTAKQKRTAHKQDRKQHNRSISKPVQRSELNSCK